MKKKLSNVAFGGSWSENILNEDEMSRALSVLEWAVENCTEQDVRTPELYDALDYIRGRVGKGEMLCKAFINQLDDPCTSARKGRAERTYFSIRNWSNIHI